MVCYYTFTVLCTQLLTVNGRRAARSAHGTSWAPGSRPPRTRWAKAPTWTAHPTPLQRAAVAPRDPADLALPAHTPRPPRAGGVGAVVWNKKTSDFPYISGVLAIVASWFVSPLVAGLISSFLFFILRALVLRSKNSVGRAIWCLPILLAITVFVK